MGNRSRALSSRVNPPWKSFLLFALVAAFAWAAYEFVYVREILKPRAVEDLTRDQRDAIREEIVRTFAEDACFVEVRGSIAFRMNEGRYRVEVTLRDGCDPSARSICETIAHIVREGWGKRTSVWAYDAGGRELGHFVD
jgi:hypothetical protein